MWADVSVIIPCFNSELTIERALRSIIGQTLSVREVIVVDDGSDNWGATSKIIDTVKDSLPVRLVRIATNRGVSYARNQGITNATSKYLAFLDSDDIWFPRKIQLQYNFMEVHRALISGHRYIQQFEGLAPNIADGLMRSRELSVWDFCLTNPFATPTVMARRESFILFNTALRRSEDRNCWIGNIAANGGAFLLEVPLAAGFKPSIGRAGLSGSVISMHVGWIDDSLSLYRQGVISLPFLILSLSAEYLKLPLRAIRVISKRLAAAIREREGLR